MLQQYAGTLTGPKPHPHQEYAHGCHTAFEAHVHKDLRQLATPMVCLWNLDYMGTKSGPHIGVTNVFYSN